jgi:arylsulfatase
VIDLVPTILRLTGIAFPQDAPPLPGHSLWQTTEASRSLWWQHEGNRALRQGDWKVVAAKGDPWELYQLSEDRAETRNLSRDHPEKVRQLTATWTALWESFQKTAREAP